MQTFTERYYLKQLRVSNVQKMFLIVFSSVCFVVLVLVVGLYSVRLNGSKLLTATCGSFSLYAAAKASYDDGNTKLDGDNDGIPCEDLNQ